MTATQKDGSDATPRSRKASTKPTKTFFIKMLTRDIALDDAVLDLLDNCLDGAVRTLHRQGKDIVGESKPYEGFRAELRFSSEEFAISDNCGGIPLELAAERAFRMGRPEGLGDDDADRGTVGVYGIGMKRALFKFGTGIEVISAGDDPFRVEISNDWLQSEDWDDFDLNPYDGDQVKGGTRIVVRDLNPSVRDAFSERDWVEAFGQYVGEHYSILINKGFDVQIAFEGDEAQSVTPVKMSMYLSATELEDGSRIAPSIYKGNVAGVDIELYAGLIAPPKSVDEADRDSEAASSDLKAGWTVVCNDRIVVVHDRTHLTGWGRPPIPSYHGQYSVIAGYAFMRSEDVSKLPLTTTKRGIDMNSSVYSDVITLMQDSIKPFITFTNEWKTAEQRTAPLKGAVQTPLSEVRSEYASKLSFNPVRKVAGVERNVPNLPSTKRRQKARRACLAIDDEEGRLVADHYGVDDESPWTGSLEKAWSETVIRARKSSGT